MLDILLKNTWSILRKYCKTLREMNKCEIIMPTALQAHTRSCFLCNLLAGKDDKGRVWFPICGAERQMEP